MIIYFWRKKWRFFKQCHWIYRHIGKPSGNPGQTYIILVRNESGFSQQFSVEKQHGAAVSQEDALMQGCQIFIGTTYQNRKNIPNDQKLYEIATKYTKWP
jgi:hypothetical protein